MRRIIMTLALSAAFAGTAAWAHEGYSSSDTDDDTTATNDTDSAGQAGTADDSGSVSSSDEYSASDDTASSDKNAGQAGTADVSGTTAQTESEASRGLRGEKLGVKPQIGVMVFDDAANNRTTRGAAGFTLDWNLASLLGGGNTPLYIGPSTGLIYSHLGAAGSNFFGADTPSGAAGADANFLAIPLNAKVAWNLSDAFRVGVHGGGNLTYRSDANSMFLGNSTAVGGNDVWRVYPNAGADVEFGFGGAALMLRPDLTITPGDEIFTGTLALAIPIG